MNLPHKTERYIIRYFAVGNYIFFLWGSFGYQVSYSVQIYRKILEMLVKLMKLCTVIIFYGMMKLRDSMVYRHTFINSMVYRRGWLTITFINSMVYRRGWRDLLNNVAAAVWLPSTSLHIYSAQPNATHAISYHSDYGDVIVVQLHGSKVWEVWYVHMLYSNIIYMYIYDRHAVGSRCHGHALSFFKKQAPTTGAH